MKIKKPSKNEWLDIIGNCPDATFFATPDWINIVERTTDYKNATRLIILDDGTKAIFPLMVIGKNLKIFSQYLSVPFYNYGGIFSQRPLSKDEVEQIIKKIKSGLPLRKIHIFSNPLSKNCFEKKFYELEYFTQILDLSMGFDHFKDRYQERDQVRKIRKARKLGVRIVCDKRDNYIEDYYKMYIDTVRRWGQADDIKKISFFRMLAESSYVKFWFAQKEDKNIAAIILVYFGQFVLFHSGAFFYKWQKERPNNLIHYEAIKDACRNKYKYYDFLPSGNLQGVEKFKETFGSKKMMFNLYKY